MPNREFDLTRTVLAVLFLGGLIGVSAWILRPFIGPLIWATMIVVATWPLMLACQRWLFGWRSLAVAAMVLSMVMIFVVPLALAIETLIQNAPTLRDWAQDVATLSLPAAPEWLSRVPVIGERLVHAWDDIRTLGVSPLAEKAAPYAAESVRWLVSRLSGAGLLFVDFMVTVVVAAILWAGGERAASAVLQFARRLGGARGEGAARLAAQAIRGVALGVVVTALVQSLCAGLGLAIAGVPFASVLTAIAFMLTLAQIGALPILVPAVIWLFATGNTGLAIFLTVWTVLVGTMDNFLRPWLIKKGADLPLLLIFAGVVGGLIAFGIIGIFVGPVALAVTYTLLSAWMEERGEANPT